MMHGAYNVKLLVAISVIILTTRTAYTVLPFTILDVP